jgi:transposase
VCKVKLGYEFCYLYVALAPATGDLIALILPDMSKESFGVFVDFFSEQTRALYGKKQVVLIADKAGSHQQSICEQRGIVLQQLPTACPELNPVERFFEELRKPLADRIFENIEEVEIYLCQILKRYYNHPEQIIQLCYYPYMRTT